MRILLVEDDVRVAGFIAKGLREASYAVDVATDGEAGLYRAAVNGYDLVILDVLLPLQNGYAVCRSLRRSGFRGPVLMLTARDAIDDRVAGLDAGADDYLVKPFDFKELLARLRALLRRSGEPRPDALTFADLTVNTLNHSVKRGDRQLNLTAKEYALLEFLVINHDKVLGREIIARHVWEESFDAFTNVIDVYIKRLRNKLEVPPGTVRLIHTCRGEGYILALRPEIRDV